MPSTSVVIIGAGIVGCSLADELTARGLTDVTVVEQGPLPAPGGSTSHAPGLVFRTNPSRTMTGFAAYTTGKFRELGAFDAVGGLEVATTADRWADLHRKAGLATSWGVRGELVGPGRCRELWPLLDERRVVGGFHTPGDGIARAVDAAHAQRLRAEVRGARFLDRHTVTGIVREDGPGGPRVTGVVTDRGEFAAPVVVSAAGLWGPVIGALAGVPVPLLPLAHQYATTGAVPELSGKKGELPILRHQDRDLYFRTHGDRVGIGSYAHRPLPVDPRTLPAYDGTGPMPASLAFTEADFAPSWTDAVELLPALDAGGAINGVNAVDGINGVFSFTPDGFPLLGESPYLRGFWLAEAVWVTHSAGAARAVAEWIADGRASVDVHECDAARFEGPQLSPPYVRERAVRAFVEVYDIVHPLQPPQHPRPLRISPFHARQRELGAHFLEGGGWERPQWYEANAPLAEGISLPVRDAWAARHWSPICAAEARATRERVALHDMTPLRRIEVGGPGALAFLQRTTSNQLEKPVGSVTYTLLLDGAGGIRSDLTVARLGPERFQIGANSPADVHWLTAHAPDGVHVRDITSGTCCVGVWGPLARELVQPLTDADLSHGAFGYFRAKEVYVGDVPVTALRVSYVGELGWELYTCADLGARLWDTLWAAGRPLGLVAAGRGAFESLRLEKGYRAWGRDMTARDTPREAGLSFAVRPGKGPFTGRDALADAPVRRVLRCLTLDDPGAVVLGGEPVHLDGVPVGYVTSAGYGYTVGRCVAYAWLPAGSGAGAGSGSGAGRGVAPGTAVHVEYFGEKIPATVAEEPLYDPESARIRR